MAQGIQKIQQQLPFPQQGLSQHFQANELHCIFSFRKCSVLLELSGSVKTAKETLDTTSASWMITEFLCFKEKRLLNDFSFLQLSKVVLLSLQAAAAQAFLHKRTELKFMQHSSSTQCSGSEMQDWAKHWPNCTFSYIKRIELVCSPLTSAL